MLFGKTGKAKKSTKARKSKKSTKEKKESKKTGQPAKLSEKDVKERLQQGWARAIIVFELAGKPKEHIEQTLPAYIENIKRDERVAFLSEEYGDIVEHEDGIFSMYCETDLLVQNLDTLTWLAINFSPASIEVLEPGEFTVPQNDLTAWLNDLLSKLHEVSNILREERSVNNHLTTSLNALIKNSIKAALREGPKDIKELEEVLGIHHEQLKPFADHLVEKEQLTKEGDAYSRA